MHLCMDLGQFGIFKHGILCDPRLHFQISIYRLRAAQTSATGQDLFLSRSLFISLLSTWSLLVQRNTVDICLLICVLWCVEFKQEFLVHSLRRFKKPVRQSVSRDRFMFLFYHLEPFIFLSGLSSVTRPPGLCWITIALVPYWIRGNLCLSPAVHWWLQDFCDALHEIKDVSPHSYCSECFYSAWVSNFIWSLFCINEYGHVVFPL